MTSQNTPLPDYHLQSDIDLKIPFHDYQRIARRIILDQPYCGLFLDCGLGKTLITLAALYDLNPNSHVLIIAPKNVTKSTWLNEIKKWNIPIRTESFLMKENGKERTLKEMLELYKTVPTAPPTVYFINRDRVSHLVKHMPLINKKPVWYFPTVIIDEAQSFKSNTSERFKALKRVRPAIKRLIELTGTPTPKGLIDLWAEIYLLDMGQRLGPTITAYRQRYFHPTAVIKGHPVGWEPNPGVETEIYDRISDIVISIKNPNLQLPETTYHDAIVYMSNEEKDAYKQLLKTKVLDLDSGEQIIARSAGVLSAKLLQMASGTLYTDEEHNFAAIHSRKLDMLEYIIENTGSPVLVAYWFQCDKKRITDRIPQAVVFNGTPDMLHNWNQKKIPVMLIHPASDGTGLNLQDGGHTLVWYTLSWSLEHYIQTNARIARQGQKEPVIIHRLITDGTIDEKCLCNLLNNDMSEQALLDAIALTLQEQNA